MSQPPEIAQIERRLMSLMTRASADHRLLEPGDRVMVAVSGGKDSHVLLHLLRELQKRAPFKFSLVAVNVDQKQPGFPEDVLPRYFTEQGYEHLIVEDDTYSIVKEKVPEGKTTCSLCSRLRRGILYNTAVKLGATKIALGHHRDDLAETLLLNMFYSGQLKAMPARLRSDDGRNTVIRPLVYCAEKDIEAYSLYQKFPIIPCNLCGSQPNLHRRKMKELLHGLEALNSKVPANILAALSNVRPSHLLDRELMAALGGVEAVEEPEATEQARPIQLGFGPRDATAP